MNENELLIEDYFNKRSKRVEKIKKAVEERSRKNEYKKLCQAVDDYFNGDNFDDTDFPVSGE